MTNDVDPAASDAFIARSTSVRAALREADRLMPVEAVAQRFRRAAAADLLATLGQARHADADTLAA